MNNKEFITQLSRRCNLSTAETQRLTANLINSIAETLENGDSINLSQFGTFEVKKRMERIVVNPGTQQRMLVPPKLVINFKPIQAIKEKLKQGGNENE